MPAHDPASVDSKVFGPLEPSDGLPTRTVAAYGSAAAVFEMLRAPGLAILPSLYAKDYGFALTTISLAMLWLRLSDAVMDPLVGYLSDRTHSRWGPRKPWMFASIFVFVPACFVLYAPGRHPTIGQFAIAYFFYFLGWAMFDIPYTAWGTEVAKSYGDRSRLAVTRGFFANAGLLLTALIPLLPFLPSTAMTFDVTRLTAWLLAFLYPAVLVFVLVTVPAGPVHPGTAHVSLRETLRAIRGNPPLLLFIGIGSLSDLAVGIFSGMAFIFFDTYLGIGRFFAPIFITSLVVSTLSLKVWETVVGRTSKRMLLITCLVAGIFHGGLILLIEPGPLALPLFILYMTFYYVLAVGRDVALYAIIGDIVDYDSLKTGGKRAGQFTSAWMVFRKFSYAVGPAIGLFIAGVMGYDPGAAHNGALAVFGLKATNGYVPGLLMAIAAVVATRFPLTEARHLIIRRRLEQRAARSMHGAGGSAGMLG
jgi:Na+/melibiose symporter-like transporter